MKKLALALVIALATVPALAADKLKRIETPKNLVVLHQTMVGDTGFGGIAISGVDVDSGELVLLMVRPDGEYRWYSTGAKYYVTKQVIKQAEGDDKK